VRTDPFVDFWETVGTRFRPTTYGRRQMHEANWATFKLTKTTTPRCSAAVSESNRRVARRLETVDRRRFDRDPRPRYGVPDIGGLHRRTQRSLSELISSWAKGEVVVRDLKYHIGRAQD